MTNNIKMLSCPICNNPKLREYGNGIYQCDVCETYFDQNENIVLTEQEWLQTCTTEQLAEFLFEIGEYDWLENIADEYKKSLRMKQEVCDGIVEWLKQPHTKE